MAGPGQWIGPGRIGRALPPNRGATRRRPQSPLRSAPVLARVSLAIYRRSPARCARPGRRREPLPRSGSLRGARSAVQPRITPSRLWGDLAHVSLPKGCSVTDKEPEPWASARQSSARGWRSAGPAPAAPRADGRARLRLIPLHRPVNAKAAVMPLCTAAIHRLLPSPRRESAVNRAGRSRIAHAWISIGHCSSRVRERFFCTAKSAPYGGHAPSHSAAA